MPGEVKWNSVVPELGFSDSVIRGKLGPPIQPWSGTDFLPRTRTSRLEAPIPEKSQLHLTAIENGVLGQIRRRREMEWYKTKSRDVQSDCGTIPSELQDRLFSPPKPIPYQPAATMGLGVLEPKSDQKVPGTVHLERDTQVLRDLTSNLKHGSGRDENIVLVPQPSDSPNDPLSMSNTLKCGSPVR